MKTDEIKRIVFDVPLIKGAFLKKREYKNRRSKAIDSLRNKEAFPDDPDGLWLLENRELFIKTLLAQDASRIHISRFTERAFKSILDSNEWQGTQEEFNSAVESIAARNGISDREPESIPAALYLLIAEKTVEAEPSIYPYLFTLFHTLRSVRTDYIARGFSPVEQLLRSDPDGTYPKMDRKTQLNYQNKIRRMAKKAGVTAEKMAETLLEKAKEKDCHIGSLLPYEKKDRFYYPCVFLLWGAFSVAFFAVNGPVILYAFSALPLYYFSRSIVRFIYGLIRRPSSLYSMKADVITQDNKTCVVIPCILSSEKDIKPLIQRLHRFAVNNRGEEDRISFGLLCDLNESKAEEMPGDDKTVKALKEAIDSLNNDLPVFFAMLRRRSYLKTEGSFCGRERKRGAVMDFCSYCHTGLKPKNAQLFGYSDTPVGSRYLITLDSDTELSIGQARRLVAVAAHPMNKPVIGYRGKIRCVIRGHGIFQPRVNTSLLAPIKTRFGKMFSNGSGRIPYAGASFDSMQTLYGEGNFCGKGLIDIETFHTLMKGVFPDETVLSHDMPEGALLRCGVLTDQYFTDSDPQDSRSYTFRLHRWIRGDTQNLFILSHLPFLRRWFALEAYGEHLVELSYLGMLLCGAYLGTNIAIASVLLYLQFQTQSLFETVLSVLFTGNTEHFNRRFSTLMRNLILNEAYRTLYSVFSLCTLTWYKTDAILRAMYRMVFSRKHLLQWKVYSSGSNRSGWLLFYCPSLILSLLLWILTIRSSCGIIFLINVFYPVLSEFLSLPYSPKREWTKTERSILQRFAEKEFLYFKRTVSDSTHHLPPDNLQLRPMEKLAKRTSPTNIGLYLVSLVAALDLKLIGTAAFKKRLEQACNAVDQLPKYHGNLYNWYDLETMSVIGNGYVSTVDSGNFLASLIVVSSALRELKREDDSFASILDQIDRMIAKTDLSVLFKQERGLFTIGVFPEEPEHEPFYDLMMSEARLTSFLSVSLGQINPDHWEKLGRPLLTLHGRVGAASWCGTAFEYFMPPLFCPVIKDSLEDETLDYALYCQKKYGVKVNNDRLFGVSESACPETDLQGNYQYHAFGVPYLSLKNEQNNRVILAPYASFLMLERNDSSVLDNLIHLSSIGMYGAFGFYESCSFDLKGKGKREIVYSYMAHHKGMSLMALDNALNDMILRKRFFAYPGISEKAELLAERFPLEQRSVTVKPESNRKQHLPQKGSVKRYEQRDHAERVFVLSDGETTVLTDDTGGVSVSTSGILWAKQLRLSMYRNGREIQQDDQEFEKGFNISNTTVERFLKGKSFNASVKLELLPEENALLILTQCFGDPSGFEFEIKLDPVLCGKKEYDSHPAYSKLFLEVQNTDGFIHVRRRTDNEPLCLHVSSPCPGQSIAGNSSCDIAPGFNLLKKPVRIRFSLEKRKNQRIPVIISMDHQAEGKDLFNLLDGSYAPKSKHRTKNASIAARLDKSCGYDTETLEKEREILAKIVNPRRLLLKDACKTLSRDYPWRFGISGDHPIVSVFIRDKTDLADSLTCIKVAKHCFLCHIAFDLVLIVLEKDGYEAPLKEEVRRQLQSVSAVFMTDRSPGIHVISTLDSEICSCLSDMSCCIFRDPGSSSAKRVPVLPINALTDQLSGFGKNGSMIGRMTDQAFEIDRKTYDPDEILSLVCSNRRCGFVCDQKSLGFTWIRNAALGQVSAWHNDGSPGEKLYLIIDGKSVDLLSRARYVRFTRGKAAWEGMYNELSYRIELIASEKLNGKMINLSFSGEPSQRARVVYSFTPALGTARGRNVQVSIKEDHVILRPVVAGEVDIGGMLYSGAGIVGSTTDGESIQIVLQTKQKIKIYFGGFSSEKEREYILMRLRSKLYDLLSEEESFISNSLPCGSHDDKENWLAYQTVFSRFYGRAGYYQVSGAYGFRDQLQDSLIFLSFRPEITREHILRCAAHQFTEGDVQHWWHPGVNVKTGADPGVRTACSDDYIWLLYVTGRYLEETNDQSILSVSVPFLKDPKQNRAAKEAYFTPELTCRAPLSLHLESCVSLLVKRGTGDHGLAKMGSGDWNDGMNELGGESVWLSEFALICLNMILPYLSPETEVLARTFQEKLLQGIKNSFNGSWFARAYRGDGLSMGNDLSLEGECCIDLLPQAFAAFLYCRAGASLAPDAEQIRKALISAFEILVKKEERLVLLFKNPFVSTEPSPGYIQRYVAGVRENGGQYTHAAVWLMLALWRFGRKTKDDKLILMADQVENILDPTHNLQAKDWEKYRREPYVLCGDVYSAKGAKGQGGWSWYTGAAGWYWQYLQERKNNEEGVR